MKRRGYAFDGERGFSGAVLAGRRLDPPEPIGNQQFTDFQSYILRFIMCHVMEPRGRARRTTCLVASGNGNGILGIGKGTAMDGKGSTQKAQHRSLKRLMHFHTDGPTIFHDFFTQCGHTKIYVHRKPEGYGLVTHRVIKLLCQLIGIKDLYAKIEGSKNPDMIVKAFVIGLLQQRTHDQLAEEKQLFLVKMTSSGLPMIVGTPSYCRTNDEIPADENLDFSQHVFNGKIVHRYVRPLRPWLKTPGYKSYLKKYEKRRAMRINEHNTLVHYGELRSHLTDQYPEARGFKKIP